MKPELDYQNASFLGGALMMVVGFAAFAISSWYFKLDLLTVFVISVAVSIVFGFLFNLIAHVRGTKRIHWMDFAFNFLPWDF